jgi:hypothetical protein
VWDWPLIEEVKEISFPDPYVSAGRTYTYVL